MRHSLVIFRLIQLKKRGQTVCDKLFDSWVERYLLERVANLSQHISRVSHKIAHHFGARQPFLVVAEFIEGPYNLQKRICCRLSDTFIVMRQELNQLQGALFNPREEVVTRCSKHSANGVRGNLFLYSNGAVDVKHLVNINIFNLNRRIAVGIYIIGDGDGIGRR